MTPQNISQHRASKALAVFLLALMFSTPLFAVASVADGTVDTTFYSNLGTGFDNPVNDIALQSDGDILLGGSFTTLNGNTRNYLVRLNSDGTEDTAFYTNLGTGFGGNVNTLAIQSDGDILVGGAFTTLNSNTRNRLVRLNSDGTEDTAFATSLGTGFGNTVFVTTLQSDGDILVGGTRIATFNGNTRIKMVRLNSDGTEDTAFYTNLGTSFGGGASAGILSAQIQSDGDILVGGSFTTLNGNTRNYLVRLNSDGTEDTAFYTNLGTGFDSSINVAGGAFTTLNGTTRNSLVKLTHELVAPTISNVTISETDGEYKKNNTLTIVITFDEAVTVSGTPTLTLETGSTDGVASYVSGSGTTELSFTYTIASSDSTDDLDYTDQNALNLSGGSIVDGVSNSANLTLPVPGASGSLSYNKAISIKRSQSSSGSVPSIRSNNTVTNTVTKNNTPITTPINTCSTISTPLRRGIRGAMVTELQSKLKTLGMFPQKTPITGYFGKITELAVRSYQQSRGLIPTGIVGTRTLTQLQTECK
jgi:uncharacterized delta-60 repeat protein